MLGWWELERIKKEKIEIKKKRKNERIVHHSAYSSYFSSSFLCYTFCFFISIPPLHLSHSPIVPCLTLPHYLSLLFYSAPYPWNFFFLYHKSAQFFSFFSSPLTWIDSSSAVSARIVSSSFASVSLICFADMPMQQIDNHQQIIENLVIRKTFDMWCKK